MLSLYLAVPPSANLTRVGELIAVAGAAPAAGPAAVSGA
jgi:hypothetical protein